LANSAALLPKPNPILPTARPDLMKVDPGSAAVGCALAKSGSALAVAGLDLLKMNPTSPKLSLALSSWVRLWQSRAQICQKRVRIGEMDMFGRFFLAEACCW
jgi:hypothetical protein